MSGHHHHQPPISNPLIIAMKGHPGTGKSTLAAAIATILQCPLLDKDDIKDPTLELHSTSAATSSLLNELSYSILLRIAETQINTARIGCLVVDSPLSNQMNLKKLLGIVKSRNGKVVVVECIAGNETEWRRRLEERAKSDKKSGRGWHKPQSWEELRVLVEGYRGREKYDLGDVPKIVVDTTEEEEKVVGRVMEFLKANGGCACAHCV